MKLSFNFISLIYELKVLRDFREVIDKNKSAQNYKMKPLQLDSIKFRKMTGSTTQGQKSFPNKKI